MSPGPDFAIVTQNCLTGDFKKGILAGFGVCAALLIHVTYSIFGIALIIQESPIIYSLLKYAGAAYLLYLGVNLLLEKKSQSQSKASPKRKNPFVSGFLCNLLNPKATLFIFSIFTQFIDPGMALISKALLGSVLVIVVFLWFVTLSFLLTHPFFYQRFVRFQYFINKCMGVVLCFFALSIIFLS